MLSPIALFAYKRPELLSRTLQSVGANPLAKDCILYIFCDGPKATASEEDLQLIHSVRSIARQVTGFKQVHIIESTTNKGLAASIIQGVSQVLIEHDSIIVLEDDMIVSPFFLKYMHDGLELYRDNDEVISVHAYSPPLPDNLPETFFIVGADCWGWATWRRGWELFEGDAKVLLNRILDANSARAFDFEGRVPFTDLLKDQVAGKTDSWAICWYASAFLAGKLTLHPRRSLVCNIGAGEGATHTAGMNPFYVTEPASEAVPVVVQPLREHAVARRALGRAMLKGNGGYWIALKTLLFKRFPVLYGLLKGGKKCLVRSKS